MVQKAHKEVLSKIKLKYEETKETNMAGTITGGKLAAETNRKRYGKDFYRDIGSKGGKKGAADGAIKGFAAMTREERQAAGRKGGTTSRRGKNK